MVDGGAGAPIRAGRQSSGAILIGRSTKNQATPLATVRARPPITHRHGDLPPSAGATKVVTGRRVCFAIAGATLGLFSGLMLVEIGLRVFELAPSAGISTVT